MCLVYDVYTTCAVLQPNVVLRRRTVNLLVPPCSLVVDFQLGVICLVPLSEYTT